MKTALQFILGMGIILALIYGLGFIGQWLVTYAWWLIVGAFFIGLPVVVGLFIAGLFYVERKK